MGFLGGVIVSKKVSLTVGVDSRFVAVANLIHPLEQAVTSLLLIGCLLFWRSFSQITPRVVEGIKIDMINGVSGPDSGHPQPNDCSRVISFSCHTQTSFARSTIRLKTVRPGALSSVTPDEMSGGRVVIE